MNELAELQGRITMALDRIAMGLEALPPVRLGDGDSGGDQGRGEALTHALDELKAENARLTEALRERDEAAVARDEEVQKLSAQVDGQAAKMQQLQKSNAKLREIVEKLRSAQEEQLADPELINSAMAAELTALRASRQAEVAEMEQILAELGPLVEGDKNG